MTKAGPPSHEALSSTETPSARDRHRVLLVVGIGTLLNTLAGSSINLALPVIGAELGIAVQLLRWIVLAFMLVVAVLLLGAGRAVDLWGHRSVYQAGFALFGAASLFCGLAGSFELLVAGRALQGVGAALTMAAAPALLTSVFPPAERGRALGILGSATYVGLTIGPPVGGLLIKALGWRWIFFFNVPVTLLMVVAGQRWLPRGERHEVRFDLPGLVTLMLGLPLLLLALSEGAEWGWDAAPTLTTALGGLVLLALFVGVELRTAAPLLDLSLFRSRVFSGSLLAALANYIALFVSIILLPFYLLEALRIGPAQAGALLSCMPLVMAAIASPSGWLSDKVGTRGLSIVGLAVLAASMAGLARFGLALPPPGPVAGTRAWLALGPWLAAMGLGTGTFISPNSSAVMGAAPRQRQGTAGSVLGLARTVGMLAGVSLGTAVFRAWGGHSGGAWRSTDVGALQVAFYMAAAIAALGAVAGALRGGSAPARGRR